MADRRDIRVRLRSILAATGSPDSPAARICAACVEMLPLTGAAISVIAGSRARGTVCASDSVMERVEDLQFTTGIGPCVDVVREGRPVMVPVLDRTAQARWPLFTTEAANAGVAALFAW